MEMKAVTLSLNISVTMRRTHLTDHLTSRMSLLNVYQKGWDNDWQLSRALWLFLLTWDEEALKKARRSFQARRYPWMKQCSILRGCTTANSPTCTPPRIFSKSSSVAERMLINAAGGDLKEVHTVSHLDTIKSGGPRKKLKIKINH